MTYGIYKLSFGPLHYIGKSEDIESRSISHRSDLKTGKSPKLLLDAFHKYGFPTISILEEIWKDPANLARREAHWIAEECPTLNDANPESTQLKESPKEKLVNDPVRTAFKLLMKKHDWVDLCVQTGFTIKMLESMMKGLTHTWLINEFPINYPKMRVYANQWIINYNNKKLKFEPLKAN